MIPQTPFEETGNWTSIEDEEIFLNSLAGVGGMELNTLGVSVLNRPIYECSIGNQDGLTVYIVSLQHGREPATRESSMALVRDLCYRAEPWLDEYLENNKIIVVPTMNPDGRVKNLRNNENDVNLNRDWFQITQPETEAVFDSIQRWNPSVVLDAHETSAGGGDWRPYPAGLPGEHEDLRRLATDFVDSTETDLLEHGWTTLWYRLASLPWTGLSTVSGALNRVGILSETVTSGTPKDRVDLSLAVYKSLLVWTRDNAQEISDAINKSKNSHREARYTEYPTREYVGSGEVRTTDAIGYRLKESLPDKHMSLFEMEEHQGVIGLNQSNRLAVAALLDPNSSDSLFESSRVFQEDKDRFSSVVVKRGNLRYPAKGVMVRRGNLRYPAKDIVVKRGNLRYPR